MLRFTHVFGGEEYEVWVVSGEVSFVGKIVAGGVEIGMKSGMRFRVKESLEEILIKLKEGRDDLVEFTGGRDGK